MARDETVTAELIARFVRGDALAEYRLFERFHDALLRRTRSQHRAIISKAKTSAEDLVAEVFERALAADLFGRFDDDSRGAFEAMLRTILDRVAIDALRRATTVKRGARGIDAANEAAEELGGRTATTRDSSPSSRVCAREFLRECETALEAQDWRILTSHVLDGVQIRDLAKGEKVSEAAIRGRIRRARERLAERVAVRSSGRVER